MRKSGLLGGREVSRCEEVGGVWGGREGSEGVSGYEGKMGGRGF